jgi:type IV pilus assembly protein PilX
MSTKSPNFPQQQSGAVLFIGLIMLLVITMLAVTSMREVTLESRITGNVIEQKRLHSAAEAALREAERRIMNNRTPPDTCPDSLIPGSECILGLATNYHTDFSKSFAYQGLDDTATTLDRSARWYLRDATNVGNVQASCTQTEDFLSGKNCTNYYEVNSQSYSGTGSSKNCGPDALCIRSVISAIYN